MREHWPYALGVVLSYLVAFLLFPAVLGYVEWSAVGSWYPLLLQLADGVGDLSGKLLPIWTPLHPHATITVIGCSRLLFIPVFILGLAFARGAAFFFVLTFLVSLTAWYEAMIFSLACEGLHPDSAYQVESLLAFMVQVGSLSGALLSLLLGLGPWANGAAVEW
ncbi:hypothetical protein OEZ85_013966 [Tetradesmus obliquus]|uniref:Uncharacterized protein n=1 Tax=Tetradesmus obliquus TaxID=3088 RepID=A0ABY8U6R7_TETOB|nr:hypothetical protein OEZ85_013966 [Tetradesmus obliquus]